MNNETTIARQIAAEDIQIGQYIAKLHNLNTCDLCEILDEGWKQRSKWELPWDIEPYEVKGVCLPYLLVVDAEGDVATIDVRRHRFAILPQEFGRVPFDIKKEKLRREKSDSEKTSCETEAQ